MYDINIKTSCSASPSVVGHKNIKQALKYWQEHWNASYTSFSNCVCPDLVWSLYKRNFDANVKVQMLKMNYLESNQLFKIVMDECKSFHCKVWNIKDSWN